MNEVIDLSFWQMLAATAFVIILMVIVRIKKISREKEILIASVRMTVQLILTGYLLVYLFDNPSVYYTLFLFILMEIFAVFNIIKRTKNTLSRKLKKVIAFSIFTGTTLCLAYFLLVVVQLSPWYDPRYFITLAGMLIGNSMTGIALGIHRLTDGMQTQKNLIEGALMLGATPHMAVKQITDNAFDAAIMPTINSMVGMGIVFLPGMMTGQILSGTSPVTAIEYQIAIMLGILGSVALSVILSVQIGYKTFFNNQAQLVGPTQNRTDE